MKYVFKKSKIVEYLIYLHILLISFQLAIRELLIDTTFIRDVILIIILLVWSFKKKEKSLEYQKKHGIVLWLKYIIVYGIAMSFIQIIYGISVLNVLLQFRNIFLPLFLFFVGKSIYSTEQKRISLINFIYFLFILILVDVWIEHLAFSVGFSKYSFPWYTYQFNHSYRYLTSPDAAHDAVNPEDSPIIGILGWPHATSATFFALFSFLITFFLNKNKSQINTINSPKPSLLVNWKIYGIFVLSIFVLIFLGVKMQLISFFPIILILFYINPNKKFSNFIGPFLFLCTILLFTKEFWMESVISKFEIAFAEKNESGSNIWLIFDFELLKNLLSYFSNISPVYIFWGGYDYSHLWFYQYLEIRLLNFSLQLGILWLFFFLGLILSSINYCLKLIRNNLLSYNDKQFALGTLLLIVAYSIDTLHYSRLMYWPNIDIFVVILGALSNIKIEKKNEYLKTKKI